MKKYPLIALSTVALAVVLTWYFWPSTPLNEVLFGSDSGALSPGTTADDATVGTRTWVNPNNSQISDNVYVTESTGGTTHYLKATNFGFSIPTGATINGILAEFERKSSQNTAGDHIKDSTIKIVKADGTFGTENKGDTVTNWSTTEAYFSYGSASDLWSETWTSTDINDVDFGVALSVLNTQDVQAIASVDHIRITVYFSTPSGGSQIEVRSGTLNVNGGTLIVR